jgi:ATP diphosphatase
MSSDKNVANINPINRLLAIMARLRSPTDGCEWDLAQDFESISRYTIEEAYEVADAIQSGSSSSIKDELGDLLLQVVFHSQIAADKNLFVFDDVCNAISDKMERRHPHIFGDTQTLDVKKQWEEIKAKERAEKGEKKILDGIALSLPALMRAQKIQSRVSRVGFDWPDVDGPRAKILEELAEVDGAVDADHRAEEVGDLLFAVVNYARHLGVDAEAALASANHKFARRFGHVEAAAGADLGSMTIEQLDKLWDSAKSRESSK